MMHRLPGLSSAIPLQAGMIVTQLAASVALAHVLSVHDRGVVLTALLLVGGAVSLVAGGLTSALSRAAGAGVGLGKVALPTVLALSVASVPVLTLVAYVAPGAKEISPLLFVAIGPLGVLGTSLAAIAAGSGRIAFSVLLQWMPSATALLTFGVVLVGDLQLSAEQAFAAYVAANLLAVVVGLRALRRVVIDLFASNGQERPAPSSFLRDVAWMHPASISQVLGLRLDVIMLAYISGPVAASVYTAATSFASPLQLPIMAARGRIIAVGEETLRRPWPSIRGASLWLGIVSVALAAGVPLIALVYGEGYEAARGPALILIIAGILLFVRDAEANTLMGAGQARSVSMIEIFAAVLSIPTYLGLIALADTVGAAVGSAVIYAFGCLAFTLFAVRYRRTLRGPAS